MKPIHHWVSTIGVCAAMLAMPVHAQQAAPDNAARLTAIEVDIDAIATEAGLLAHSRALVAAGDISGAASAQEAFLIGDERSQAVRAEYAITLCRLDDRAAGKFEGAKLVSMKAPGDVIAAVTAACGKLPSLAGLARGEELPQ